MSRGVIWAVVLALSCSVEAAQAESVSVGTPASGSLKDGVSLPSLGKGFVAYSALGNLLGRQYVHRANHRRARVRRASPVGKETLGNHATGGPLHAQRRLGAPR